MPVENISGGNVVEITAFATILGLMTWLVRRVFTHTIPRLAKDFKESLGNQAQIFKDEMQEQRSCFQSELGAQREEFKTELRCQRDDFKTELRFQREEFKVELGKLGDRVDVLAEDVRELKTTVYTKHRT